MKSKKHFRIGESLSGYLFVLPNFLGFFCFTFFPVLFSFYLGFVDWDIIKPMKFVMFKNFNKLMFFHIREITEGGLRFPWTLEMDVIFCCMMFVASALLVLRFFIQQMQYCRQATGKYFFRGTFNLIPAILILVSAGFFIRWMSMLEMLPGNAYNSYFIRANLILNAGNFLGFSLLLLFVAMIFSFLGAYFRSYDFRFEKSSDVFLAFLPGAVILLNIFPVWGFSNDIWAANDPYFWQFLGNTLFMMLAIPIGMFASLGLALLMNKKLKGIVFFRAVYFLPSICAGVALYVLWRWIYNTDLGLLNTILGYIGIPKVEWLTSTAWSKPSLMLMGIWTGVGGYNMILYLAGLQGIPLDLYEAADIDGASGWQKFWSVTWPMLSPTTFFIFVMSVIGGFQGGFDAAYIMTGGGPAGSTTTLSYYIYNNAYAWFKMGYAASIAWVLFALVFVVTLFNWKFGGKVVHY